MDHGAPPAQPAAVTPRAAGSRTRHALLALGCVLALALLLWVGCELALARIPAHRAALEDLVRRETGLEVSFSALDLRWGWYGPEAVFRHVQLGEARAGAALLRAPQLVVGLDLWRTLRTGQLEAGRITLLNPDIDFTAARTAPAPTAAPGVRGALLPAAARLLSRWRGGRIDVEGGTLRGQMRPSLPLTVGIRHAQLRRLDARWSADVLLLLPETLGQSAHLALSMQGDPAQPELADATLSFEGQRLEFSGWRSLAGPFAAAVYLPDSGRGSLELQARLRQGRLVEASGRIRAEALGWPAEAGQLQLQRLRGSWQLALSGGAWHLTASGLDLGAPAPPGASVSVDVAGDASWARGHVEGAPLALLVALARGLAPQLPLARVVQGGVVRELEFDWNPRRVAGARLTTSAQLAGLTLASPAGELTLGGLDARVSGADARLVADLEAHSARLTLRGAPAGPIDGLGIAARLSVDAGRSSWRVESDDVEIRRGAMSVAASGTLAADAADTVPVLRAHIAAKDADVAVLAGLLGTGGLAAAGGASLPLSGGRITTADFEFRGPLDARPPWSRGAGAFRGALELREGTLAGTELWPEMRALDARLEWRGAHLHAAIDAGQSDEFTLSAGSLDLDARGTRPLHLAARLRGSAGQALAWLRGHPQLSAWAGSLADVRLRGDTVFDVDLSVPAPPARPRARVTALLEGAELEPLAGLPPIRALRGALAFGAGHLQRATLTGQWLGGPVTLALAERRDADSTGLEISGHGLVDVRQALLAAGGGDELDVGGNAEWSALLTFLPALDAAHPRLALRADSTLVGVASRLPEPFAKPPGAALPLRVEIQSGADGAQLKVSLGERLRAAAALRREGELWRIERGALRLGAGAPVLPAEPVVILEGRVRRLDLPAYLALWRQAARDVALPALRARLTAAQLAAGTRSYPEVSLTAEAAHGGGQVQLQSADISGSARWPAVVSEAHPTLAHLSSFNLAQPEDAALAAGIVAALGPAAQLSIDDLRWQGRSLGRLDATLAGRDALLDVTELHLAGLNEDARGSLHCLSGACRARVRLESGDAAATLAAFGFRPELSAGHALLAGELDWPAPASLATLGGSLHMQLEEGELGRAADAVGPPFALLAVPALTAGLAAGSGGAATPRLHFAHLSADFELRDGQARTTDLHLDGDAEILVRGRVGLAQQDYDAQAWILRGEERLPAALRRFGPTPRVAAVWLSLREMFTGSAAGRAPAALRLRGTWSDPIVSPAQE